MRILVTGGAGYIGSFMTRRLLAEGHEVVVVDDLEGGHKEAIDKRAIFINGNLLEKTFLKGVFSENKFDAVIHFAGLISMKESMDNPGRYFENNIFASLNILDELKNQEIKNFIFSSTAGVYGNPVKVPIPEDHQKKPTNPYGESKLMVEQILSWYNEIFNVGCVSLRYFNAAGADLTGNLGEAHEQETHIIPNAIKALLANSEFILFGNDYDTPDGTCVRDYIHVLDLVEAHILALKKLEKDPGIYTYNVGTGKGSSNKEVIDMIKKVTGMELKVKIAERRPGDANVLVADASKIMNELVFSPKYSDLETIIKTAWEWHKNGEKFST